MQFSEQWLRHWVNPSLATADLCELLTMAGLEVEACTPVAPAFSQVVVAQVLAMRKHDNADRLNVCTVDVGLAEPLQIVCGASNVQPGLKVPCAMVGANLPGDFKIKQAKVRGVESFGMLCSAKELGLAESADGLLILDDAAPVGTSIREWLQLDDHLLTLKLTPNRADCLSIFGLARDVAALTQAPLQMPAPAVVAVTQNSQPQVEVRVPALAPYYSARAIHGVDAQRPTPAWMVQRLERSGVRSISLLVDITNYVLLERGQPLHAFDAAKINQGLQVRMAQAGETLALLNDKTVTLDAQTMVIADASGPLALAGVMGGSASAVSDATQIIVLESAFFTPEALAGQARKYGLSTDSSHRFERGVDYAQTQAALEYATELVLALAGGSAGPVTVVQGTLPQRAPVRLRPARVNKVLGTKLEPQAIVQLLQRLHLDVAVEGEAYLVSAPSYRFDLSIEEDLIEEIARLIGYNHLPVTQPRAPMQMLPVPEDRQELPRLLQRLVARGLHEVVTYAFVESAWERDFGRAAQPVALQNPLAAHLAVMRTQMIGSHLQVLQHNLKRGQTRVRIFESARVFLPVPGQDLPDQPLKLAGLLAGSRRAEQWGDTPAQAVDFYDLKAEIEALCAPRSIIARAMKHPALHPGRSAEITWVDGRVLGWMGELHPQWVQAYDLPQAPLLFELDVDLLCQVERIQAQVPSKFQAVRRDLALLVDDTITAQAVLDTFWEQAPSMLREVLLFDVYRGRGVPEGKKSLAFKLLLQDSDKTLTDQDIEAVVEARLALLRTRHNAELRV